MPAEHVPRTSNLCVTNARTKTTLYGLRSCIMTGTDTASDEPHKKRVTGGILRISSQNPVYDMVEEKFASRIEITGSQYY